MKRAISLLTALVLCLSLVCPVFAAEFVPSITDKGAPDIVPVEDGKLAEILDAANAVVDHLAEDCLIITPVSEAESSTDIPEDAREQLLDIYEALLDGTMELPYDKVSDELDPDQMVIRDLFDLSWLCDEHDEMMEENEDYSIRVTFDLGVDKNTDVYAFVYVNGAWEVVKCTNEGNGRVCCVLGDVGVLALAVLGDSLTPPAPTGDAANLTLWITVMAVSALALTAVLFLRKRETV